MVSPREYEELLDYIAEYERTDYLRLTIQLADKNITEEFFNKKHDELFEKLTNRKQDCNNMMIFRLPPAYHSVMHEADRKEYYEMIVAFKRGYITGKEFETYHQKVIGDLEGKVKNAEENDKLMKSFGDDDQVTMKLHGGCHADIDRYRSKRKTDPRSVSTFYEVN